MACHVTCSRELFGACLVDLDTLKATALRCCVEQNSNDGDLGVLLST